MTIVKCQHEDCAEDGRPSGAEPFATASGLEPRVLRNRIVCINCGAVNQGGYEIGTDEGSIAGPFCRDCFEAIEEHYRSPASASHVEMTERIANIVRRAVSGAWPEGQIEFEIAELVREAQRSASASASVRREDACQVHPVSSRVCERGTMSCTVRHSVEEP